MIRFLKNLAAVLGIVVVLVVFVGGLIGSFITGVFLAYHFFPDSENIGVATAMACVVLYLVFVVAIIVTLLEDPKSDAKIEDRAARYEREANEDRGLPTERES